MMCKTASLVGLAALTTIANGWLVPRTSLQRRSLSTTPHVFSAAISATTTTALQSSKFSQPAFSQPAFTGKDSPSQQKKKNNKKKPVVRKFGADSKIAALHAQRVKTAGRVGTKRYVDPCKVFFGNLPFNTTEDVLEEWVQARMGVPAPLLLSQVKVIRDWKTSQSKGYGFCVFTEAIHATVCIDKCNGQLLDGRPLSVNQGKKKDPVTQVMVKTKSKPAVDADEAAIQAGMAQVERMDPQEALMLRQLDPDLVDDDFDQDDGLFDDDDDSDDDGVDGFFVEDDDDDDDEEYMQEEDTPMNRKRRREMARQRKKRKPSNKGFGAP